MANKKTIAKQPEHQISPKLEPAEYRRILEALHLRSVELAGCKMERPLQVLPERATIKAEYREEARLLEAGPGNVRMEMAYTLWGRLDDSAVVLELQATYRLLYASEVELSAAWFDIFKDVNLPGLTWPFLRELVHSMTSRTILPPFTLPHRMVG